MSPQPRASRGRPRKGKPMTAAERMRAYRQRRRAAGYRIVSQWRPSGSIDPWISSDHQRLDARSLALHCRIARKIEERRELLDIPRRNLQRWRQAAAGAVPAYIAEWQAILDRPWPQVAAFITSFSDEAVRLRQSTPFAGVLTPMERKQVYDAFRA